MICGIDPSLTATGVVIGDAESWTARTFGSQPANYSPLGSDHVLNRMARCQHLVGKIMAWIESHGAEEIDAVYIEAYAFSKHDGRSRYSTEFGGILRWTLCGINDHLVRLIEVAPTSLKKFVTGKGNAAKNLMGAHIAKRWGVLLPNDNEIDAFGLFRLGLVCEGLAKPQTVAQTEVVAKILGTTAAHRRSASADQTPLNLEVSECPREQRSQKLPSRPKSSTAGPAESSTTTTRSKRPIRK